MKFYDVDPTYATFLRTYYDSKVPNIEYENNDKFCFGIVLIVNGHNYYAPISSNTMKFRTSLPIVDAKGDTLASIRFAYMFPAPSSVLTEKNFQQIRGVDPSYADLLAKEFAFCYTHQDEIEKYAARAYRIGTNPDHYLHNVCCDFTKLEQGADDWLAGNRGADNSQV